MKKQQAKRNRTVKIDFDKMDQYQFCKYAARLKDFERKEVEFHAKLKENIHKLHETVAAPNKNDKTTFKSTLFRTKSLNRDLSPNQSLQKPSSPVKKVNSTTTNIIRIKKTKPKPRQGVNSANRESRKGRNQSTTHTYTSSSANKKNKGRKPRLPSLKLSMDFDNSLNLGIPTISSQYLTHDFGISEQDSRYNIEPIYESKRHKKHLSGVKRLSGAHSDHSLSLLQIGRNTTKNFYQKPPIPNAKLRPVSGNSNKPPIGKFLNKNN